jgi:uncharacterized membrane protein YecN with MAPEG domain
MKFEFNLPATVGVLIAFIAIGTIGLMSMDVMQSSTILMMVTPAMIVFGGLCLAVGIKHGEFRASS